MILRRIKGSQQTPEIAIAHDYLTQRGGAERVVLALHRAYPHAPIYTTLYNPDTTYPEFRDCKIITSPLNKIGFFRRNHRLALPLLPIFSSLLKIRAKKAIASSTGWSHGFNLPNKSIVYCHSPARWLYLTEQYFGERSNPIISMLFRIYKPYLLWWDKRAANRRKTYIANSTNIKNRISRVYGIEANIVFPPCSVSEKGPKKKILGLESFTDSSDYFLLVSRLLPYKNIQFAIEAFKNLEKKLLIIGSGPMQEELIRMSDHNIRLVANISDEEMRYAYSNCIAALAVSYEDFGITPLEAGTFGKPTIALKAGGFLDTIKEGVNGTFIDSPDVVSIAEKVRNFDPKLFNPKIIRETVGDFSEKKFHNKINNILKDL